MTARLWWTSVKRSYAPYFLPLPVAILYFVQSSEPNQDWRTEWLWTSMAAGRWLLFGGAVIAGATAWEAWLTRRRAAAFEPELTDPHAGRLAVWLGAVTWWLALHLAILAFYLITAAGSQPVGRISMLTLGVQVAAVAGNCAAGTAAGWWIKSPLAAPALAVVLVAATVVDLSQYGMHFRGLTWFGSVRSLIGLELVPALLLYRLGFFAALVLLIVVAVRHRLVGQIATAAALVLAVTFAVPAINPRQQELRPAPLTAHVCTDGRTGPQVCGVPELQRWYPQFVTQLTDIETAIAEDAPDTPRRFRVYGEAVPLGAERGVGQIRLRPSLIEQPDQRHAALIEAVIIPFGCLDAGTPPSQDAQLIASALLALTRTTLGLPASDDAPQQLVDGVRALPPTARMQWFSANYRRLWSCEQTGFTLPDGVTYPGFGANR